MHAIARHMHMRAKTFGGTNEAFASIFLAFQPLVAPPLHA
jgi:hypothetical protein